MSNLVDMNELWAEVHTLHFDASSDLYQTEKDWFYRLREAPNGNLLRDNSFFDALRVDNKVYIMHVSRDIEKINASSMLYPSAGCLVGCVYGTQLYKQSDGRFLMHNLGKHILTKEASKTSISPTPIVIEMSFDTSSERPLLSGINYLKMGRIHHTIYEELKYLLSPAERSDLENRVTGKVRRSIDFVNTCYKINKEEKVVPGREFIRLVNRTIPQLAILGYIYFEAIAEYTMLHGKDYNSVFLKKRGEFNNTIYKEFLLDVYKKIGRFKLSDFNLTVEYLEEKVAIMNADGVARIEIEDMLTYVARRICDMVVNYFLNNPDIEPKWLGVAWDYDGLSSVLGPLVGHGIHRELRNFNRYNDFYFYFDQFKALSVWNFWNKMRIALPFNGPIQKGEIGINPAYQDAKYKIFTAKVDPGSENFLIIDRERPDIEITPRLIDLRHTAMRSSDHIKVVFSERREAPQ